MTKKQTYSSETVTKYLSDAPKAVSAYILDLEQQIQNLSQIGLALSKERDMSKLLEMILLMGIYVSISSGQNKLFQSPLLQLIFLLFPL